MITREEARKIAAKYGIGEVPPDDPIYSEPPTIRFVNRTLSMEEKQRQELTRKRLDAMEEEHQRMINIGMQYDATLKKEK